MHATTTELLTCCPLPRVDGHGLTRAESDRVNRARNNARADHGNANPDTPMSEVDRAGRLAAAAELRRVLADRTAALAPCCPAGETQPCLGCADPGESGPSTWPAWTDADAWELGPADDFEPSDADRAWWAEASESATGTSTSTSTSTPRRPAAALGLIPTATAERLAGLSLVGRHGDVEMW